MVLTINTEISLLMLSTYIHICMCVCVLYLKYVLQCMCILSEKYYTIPVSSYQDTRVGHSCHYSPVQCYHGLFSFGQTLI